MGNVQKNTHKQKNIKKSEIKLIRVPKCFYCKKNSKYYCFGCGNFRCPSHVKYDGHFYFCKECQSNVGSIKGLTQGEIKSINKRLKKE